MIQIVHVDTRERRRVIRLPRLIKERFQRSFSTIAQGVRSMIHDNTFSNMGGDNSGHCLLSYELLLLLEWLIEHDKEKFKTIIDKALRSGLRQKLATKDTPEYTQEVKEQAHYTIIDFFGLLENALADSLQKTTTTSDSEKKLLSTLQHLDATTCDKEALRGTIAKTATKLQENPCDNAQQLLFEELLKSWKPGKKNLAH